MASNKSANGECAGSLELDAGLRINVGNNHLEKIIKQIETKHLQRNTPEQRQNHWQQAHGWSMSCINKEFVR